MRCRSEQAGALPQAPRIAVLLVSGTSTAQWRTDLRQVSTGMIGGLRRWYQDHIARDRSHMLPGFDVSGALAAALHASQGQVPIYLICGALSLSAGLGSGTADAAGPAFVLAQLDKAQQSAATKRRQVRALTPSVPSLPPVGQF